MITLPVDWPGRGPQCCITLPTKAIARHKITSAVYLELLYAQGGVCALCAGHAERLGAAVPLGIDHDHVCCPTERRTCGRCVRGLLCSGCNSVLGSLEYGHPLPYCDDGWVAAARAYLLRAGCDPDAPGRRDWFRREAERRREIRRSARLAAGTGALDDSSPIGEFFSPQLQLT